MNGLIRLTRVGIHAAATCFALGLAVEVLGATLNRATCAALWTVSLMLALWQERATPKGVDSDTESNPQQRLTGA